MKGLPILEDNFASFPNVRKQFSEIIGYSLIFRRPLYTRWHADWFIIVPKQFEQLGFVRENLRDMFDDREHQLRVVSSNSVEDCEQMRMFRSALLFCAYSLGVSGSNYLQFSVELAKRIVQSALNEVDHEEPIRNWREGRLKLHHRAMEFALWFDLVERAELIAERIRFEEALRSWSKTPHYADFWQPDRKNARTVQPRIFAKVG
jgi:hypothetical protein